MEPIAIRYPLTTKYIVASVWVSFRVALIGASILGPAMIVFGFVATDASGAPDLGSILPAVALLAFVWLVIPLACIWRLRGMLGQTVDVVFDAEGVRQNAFGLHFQGDWSAVKAATRSGPFLLVKLRGSGTFGIPIAAFESPAEAETLLATVRAHIATSKK